MPKKEVRDVLEDVSTEFIDYFKSISAPDNETENPAVPKNAAAEIGAAENGAPNPIGVSENAAAKTGAAKTGAAENDTTPKIAAAKIGAAPKNAAAKFDTPAFDGTLSTVLEILDNVHPYILTSPELTNNEKVILMYLFDTSLKSDYLVPISYRELSSKTNITLNTVIKAVKSLESLGFLKYTKGSNQNLSSKADLRGLYRKLVSDLELSVQVTDFLDAWYTKICCTKNCSTGRMLCMYVFNNINIQNIQNKDLMIGAAAKNDTADSDLSPKKIKASSGDSLRTILTYCLARGFDPKKVSVAFINYVVETLDGISGKLDQRLAALKDQEMSFLVAVEYTRERKETKKPWNYVISCVKNGYTSAGDTMEIRERMERYLILLSKYFEKPEEVELLGVQELAELAEFLTLKMETNPKSVGLFRQKLKDRLVTLSDEVKAIVERFRLNIGSRSDELFSS